MTAALIDGRHYASELRDEVSQQIKDLTGQGARPGLATVLVGADYAAGAYERRLRRLAESLDCYYVCEDLAADAAEAEVLATIGKLNSDPRISGILVLRPLPEQVSEVALYRVLSPLKDIEAVHPVNAGLLAEGRARFLPSTPSSAFHMLERYLEDSGRDQEEFFANSNIVVVGRSNNVGKPAVLLGMARNATVVACDVHSYRAGLLYQHTAAADVVIVAAGVPGLIKAEHVKDGVIVVDVGINPVTNPETGKVRLVGDVDFESVSAKAEAISPVPGGVGPITDIWLLRNTVAAAALAKKVDTARASLEGLTVSAADHDAFRARIR